MDSLSNELVTVDQALAARLTDIDARTWVKEHAAPYNELMAYYRCAMMEAEARFKVLNEDLALRGEDNPIESIKTRLKTPESIVEKLLRNGYPLTVDSIEASLFDVAGVRVICSFCSEV